MTDDLIARLEAATGPDRELDAEIAGTDATTVQWHSEEETPRFTASIDAALTLAEDKDFAMRQAHRWVGKRFELHMRLWPADQDYGQWFARGLCIAALERSAHD